MRLYVVDMVFRWLVYRIRSNFYIHFGLEM